MLPRPTASASPGNLVEMHIFRSHILKQILWEWAATCVFTHPLRDSEELRGATWPGPQLVLSSHYLGLALAQLTPVSLACLLLEQDKWNPLRLGAGDSSANMLFPQPCGWLTPLSGQGSAHVSSRRVFPGLPFLRSLTFCSLLFFIALAATCHDIFYVFIIILPH